MKRYVLFFLLIVGFAVSVFGQNQSVVAEYRCELDANTYGTLTLYSDGSYSASWTQNGRQREQTGYYELTANQIVLGGTHNNGKTFLTTWALIPRTLNGQQYYESIWISAFVNGVAERSVSFSPLGVPLSNGGLVNGKMTRVR